MNVDMINVRPIDLMLRLYLWFGGLAPMLCCLCVAPTYPACLFPTTPVRTRELELQLSACSSQQTPTQNLKKSTSTTVQRTTTSTEPHTDITRPVEPRSEEIQDAKGLRGMADGGQRLLDVIDDPNALESFLGCLTSDSGAAVDHVVDSLARSLAAEYEVDSPSEALFDTLESSNNLTDISQSNVPFDFGNEHYGDPQQLQEQHGLGSHNGVPTTTGDQFHLDLNTTTSTETISSQQQYTSSSICDSNSTWSESTTSTTIDSTSNSLTFTSSSSAVATYSSQTTEQLTQQLAQQLQQQQQQQQLQQQQQQQQNSEFSTTTPTTALSSSVISTPHTQSQSSASITSGEIPSTTISIPVQQNHQISGALQQGSFQVQLQQVDQQQQQSAAQTLNSVFTTAGGSTDQQSFVGTTLSQLVQRAAAQAQQQHVLAAGSQLITTTSGGNIAIQSGGHAQQSFIIDSTGQALVATGGGGFGVGGANLALVSTGGGQPTYAVLPATSQLFSAGNGTITMQPQIQALKSANGSTTYFQTNTPLMAAATTLQQNQQLQTTTAATVAGSQNSATQNIVVRPKQPPQLLPKPSTASTTTASTSSVATTSTISANAVTGDSSGGGSTNTVSSVVSSTNLDNFSQLLQQQQQQQSSIAQTGMTISQPQFAFAQNAQVVVSGVTNLSTMTSPQTIVLNHFGQQMIVPTATMGQSGLQFILRQQPTQPQVLTIQAPTTAGTIAQTTTNGKQQIVRYVSQMPQVTQNHSIQLQQIQTANGPQWVAVRVPTQTQAQPMATTAQFAQIQSDSVQAINLNTVQQYQQQSQQQQQQVQVVQQQQQQQQIQVQQVQVQQQKPPEKPKPAPAPPVHSTPTTKDTSLDPPPKKKAKSKSKKKVVTLDLEQLLKQSGIMDEDLMDDDGNSFFEASYEQAMDPSTVPSSQAPPNGMDAQISYTVTTPTTTKPNGTMKNAPTPTIPFAHVLKPSPTTKQKQAQGAAAVTTTAGTAATPPKKAPPRNRSKKKPPPPPEVVDVKPTLPPPPPVVATPPAKPKAPPRNRKKPTPASISTPAPVPPVQIKVEPPSPVIAKKSSPKKRSPPKKPPAVKKEPPSDSSNLTAAILANSLAPGATQAAVCATTTPATVVASKTSNGGTRVVQTIQLSPQNQQLLRNIQAQVQRLLSIAKRNETEQTALQKLIVLQQQVISSGTPVSTPSHLTLAQASGKGTDIKPTAAPTTASSSAPTNDKSGTLGGNVGETVQYIIQKATSKTLTQPPPLVLNNKLTPSAGASTNGANPAASAAIITNLLTNGQQKIKVETTTAVTTTSKMTNGFDTDNQPSSTSVCRKRPFASITPPVATVKEEVGIMDDEKVTSSTATTTTTNTLSTTIGQQQQYNTQQISQIQVKMEDFTDYDEEEEEDDEERAARMQADEEARIKWRKDEFEKRIKEDQDFFLTPDYKTPFASPDDAVERLLKYHIARERTEMSFEEFDCDFAETACHLLDKFNGMVSKYRALLLKESMREAECSERVMLERIFVGEEKVKLEHDKEQVAQGEILSLPPPPPSWVPKVQELVDAEMKEMERNSIVNEQVQSAIESIITFGNNDLPVPDECEKIEYDAFGVPILNNGYNSGMNSTSSADIDEAVRSILT